MNWNLLLEQIEKYNDICIFRHINPDIDALGSQNGLKNWLKDNYPNKNVYALGSGGSALFPLPDSVSDDIISKSLAISLDTPVLNRIDDQRISESHFIVMIDHHPIDVEFANLIFQDTSYASTCEMIADFIKTTNTILTETTAKMLYSGMLTDTLLFTTNNTTYRSLEMASFLAKTGFNINELNRSIFDMDLNEYKFKAHLASMLQIKDNFGYAVLCQDDFKPFDISLQAAKNSVSEFGNLNELNIWAIFVLNPETNLYDGSLRSKHESIIPIAKKFNGGGHKNACGVKGLSIDNLNEIIQLLQTLSK